MQVRATLTLALTLTLTLTKGAASGMSWDDERKMWNQAASSNPFSSNPFARRGGGGSPWDLRSNLG